MVPICDEALRHVRPDKSGAARCQDVHRRPPGLMRPYGRPLEEAVLPPRFTHKWAAIRIRIFTGPRPEAHYAARTVAPVRNTSLLEDTHSHSRRIPALLSTSGF